MTKLKEVKFGGVYERSFQLVDSLYCMKCGSKGVWIEVISDLEMEGVCLKCNSSFEFTEPLRDSKTVERIRELI